MPSTSTADAAKPVIVLTGGGTGGHITPLLAVAHAIKKRNPHVTLVYIGERDGKFAELTNQASVFDQSYQIPAGKFRRYHGESWFKRLFDVKTNALNARDVFRVVAGYFQSRKLLKRLKPSVVFLKGGFVGFPVGLAAGRLGILMITHDSDALPGIANQWAGKRAKIHATAQPAEVYSYPAESVRQVGVLVGEQYQPITPDLQAQYKRELGIAANHPLLLVTGGSLGAQRLNEAMKEVSPLLLDHYPELHIVHQVGKGHQNMYGNYHNDRLEVREFLDGLYRYTGAADVVVTRAGANTLAELGVQGKACIVVPNPLLAGGHQLKNAEHLVAQKAVRVVDEAALKAGGQVLQQQITDLLDHPDVAADLGRALQTITIPDAADKLAELLLKEARLA